MRRRWFVLSFAMSLATIVSVAGGAQAMSFSGWAESQEIDEIRATARS